MIIFHHKKVMKMFQHPLSLYAKLFGGAYTQWLDTPNTDEKTLQDAINSSEYFIPATKALDTLLQNALNGARNISITHREWINSRVVDDLAKSREKVVITLCSRNHLEVLKWLSDNFPDTDIHVDEEWSFQQAAVNGHLGMLKWLIERFPDINVHIDRDRIYKYVVAYGQLEVLKWLLIKFPMGISSSLVILAVNYGYLEILEWIEEKYTDEIISNNRDKLFSSAASNGHTSIVEWLYNKYYTDVINKYLCDIFLDAALNEKIEVMEWLCSQFHDLNERDIFDADRTIIDMIF